MDIDDPDISFAEKVRFLEQNPEEIERVCFDYEDAQLGEKFDLLYEMAISTQIDAQTKYTIYTTLMTFAPPDDKEKLELALAAYIPPTLMLEIQVLCWLFSFPEGEKKYLHRLYKYLSTATLSDRTRYEQLRTLIEKGYKQAGLIGMEFLPHQKISSRITILCAQFLFQEKYTEMKFVTDALFQIAEDEKMDYNTRADAADTLHHYLRDELQEKAFQILLKLGSGRNIYDNKQNIHYVDVSEVFNKVKDVEVKVNFESFAKYFKQTYNSDPILSNNIANSLTRIVYDVAQYNEKTAKQLVELVWNYVMTSPNRAELERRMVEEFVEMDDTCSSGHALRLLNVLSGFDGVSVHITFEQQIIANFAARMNARFRRIPDSHPHKADILADMIGEVRGKHYQTFFISNVGELFTELYKEFVPQFVNDENFDIAFKNAIEKYQGDHEIKELPRFKLQNGQISEGFLSKAALNEAHPESF